MLMRLMSKGEYLIVPKGTKFTGAGKLGLSAVGVYKNVYIIALLPYAGMLDLVVPILLTLESQVWRHGLCLLVCLCISMFISRLFCGECNQKVIPCTLN